MTMSPLAPLTVDEVPLDDLHPDPANPAASARTSSTRLNGASGSSASSSRCSLDARIGPSSAATSVSSRPEAWLAYIAHHIASKKVPIWVHGLETERVLDHYEWHEVGPDHLFHAPTTSSTPQPTR